MTTCMDCVTALSTNQLTALARDPAFAAHVATCPSCSRLVTQMLAAEQRLAMSLDMSMPTMPPTQLALDAITQSELERRKSAGRWIRRALAFVAGLILVLFLRSDRGESLVRPDNFRRQSVELHCISTQAAVELATPILRSSSARIYTVRDLSLVTVEGLDPEVSEALALIASMDNPSRCTTLPHPSAAPIIPSGEGQGKD